MSNTLFGVGAQLLRFTVGAFVLGYTVRELGQEEWGLVSLATATVSLLALLRLGAAAGVGKRLNTLLTRGEMQGFRRSYTAGMVLCALVSAVMVAVAAAILLLFWDRMNIPEALGWQAKWVFALTVAAAILSTFMLPYNGAMQALHRVDVTAILDSSALLGRALVIVLVFEVFRPQAWIYALVVLASILWTLAGSAVFVRRRLPQARVDLGGLRWSELRSFLAFNALTLFDGLIYVLFVQAPMIAFQREGLIVTGRYGVALQLNILFSSFSRAVINAVRPVAVSLEASGLKERFVLLYRMSNRVFSAGGLMMWGSIALLGAPLLRLWLKKDVGNLTEALPWLMASAALWVLALPSEAFLVAIERLKLTSAVGLTMVAVAMASIFAVQHYCPERLLPISGVILTCTVLGFQLARVTVMARAVKLRPGQMLLDLLGRPMLVVLPACLVMALLRSLLGAEKVWTFATIAVSGGVCFLAAAAALLFDPEERALAMSVLRSVKARSQAEPPGAE